MGKIWEFDEYSNNIALIDEAGHSLSYAELICESDALVKSISHRCLVFIICRNEIGSVLGYVSFLNNGIVPVMLNGRLDDALLDNLLSVYSPEYLWVPSDQIKRFGSMNTLYEAFGYTLLNTGFEKKFLLFEELALLVTTSGSTGSPKLVRQSYENLRNNAESICEYLKLDETERPITTLPMNYVYGLSIINSHFLVGATILLTDKSLMDREFWNFFKEEKATSFGGVPYTYEMLDRLRFYSMKLPSLKTMTQAGGKITPELHEKFAQYAKDNDKDFVVMYGAAEATSRMGYLPPQKSLKKKGSMGIPIPGGKFRLIGDDGKEIEKPFVAGELVYSGKNVTLGYAERGEDLSKGDERHGILETGDIAQFDEEGFFYIVGRKKRFLKIYGNRVNLDEIDRMVKSEFGIEAVCSGEDDRLVIFVMDEKVSEEVRNFVIKKTKLNPAAFSIKVIDEIPKNDSGKILYSKLKEFF